MTAGARAVQAALDTARPAIGRLSGATRSDDVAAAILEAWDATEAALRALVAEPSLGGQALIRELRQRSALTLDQAHALVEFGAAADRVRAPDYTPTEGDVRAARVGFQQLEAVAAPGATRPAAAPAPEPAVVPPATDTAPATAGPTTIVTRRRSLGPVLAIVLVLLVVGVGAFAAWRYWSGPRQLQQARAAYAAGRRIEAREKFTAVAQRQPKLAEPHIYLGRMAREDGDRATALRELETAIRLEPNNGTALREMGSYLLSIGDAQLASRFYVRAIEANAQDQTAMGYLACALVRLGRFEEAQRFLTRAGQGPWSSCAMLPAPGAGMPLPSPVR